MLTLRAVYHLALQATEGLARSVFALLEVALPVPSYTLSRRATEVEMALGALPRSGPLPPVSDSSGVKVYGKGEWKVRQQGWSKRRTWRKLHLGVDEARGEIVAAVASEAGVSDDNALPDLLEQVKGPIDQVSADGAYDKRRCYEALEERGAKAVIPPRRDAKIWQHRHCAGAPWQRAENLRAIRRQGRRRWKQEAGYPRHSLAETTFFRCQTLFGPTLRARAFSQQAPELFIKVAVLNPMTHLGMPDSSRLAA